MVALLATAPQMKIYQPRHNYHDLLKVILEHGVKEVALFSALALYLVSLSALSLGQSMGLELIDILIRFRSNTL